MVLDFALSPSEVKKREALDLSTFPPFPFPFHLPARYAITITFYRPDRGFLQVTPLALDQGMLDVTLIEAINLGADRTSMTIQNNGAVF